MPIGTWADYSLGEIQKAEWVVDADLIRVKIKTETWAPGMWAGSEGLNVAPLFSELYRFQIYAVDLENRDLYLKAIHNTYDARFRIHSLMNWANTQLVDYNRVMVERNGFQTLGKCIESESRLGWLKRLRNKAQDLRELLRFYLANL